MFDVVAFSETMIRLSPPNYQRLEQTNSFDVQIGGGELNVAVGVVFKIKAEGKSDDRGFKEISPESYKEVARRLAEKFRFKAVGGELVSLKALRDGKLDAITSTARQFLEAVRSGRAAAAGKSP